MLLTGHDVASSRSAFTADLGLRRHSKRNCGRASVPDRAACAADPSIHRAVNADFYRKYDMRGKQLRTETSGLCAQKCGVTRGCTVAAWVRDRPWGNNCYLKRAPQWSDFSSPDSAVHPTFSAGVDLHFVNGYDVPSGTRPCKFRWKLALTAG